MPNLLDLPVELRHQIFDTVFEIDPVRCGLRLNSIERDDAGTGHGENYVYGPRSLYMTHEKTRPSHPLMFVSRTIRAEALSRSWIELKVMRTQLSHYVYRVGSGWSERSYGSSVTIGPGAVNDDFRGLLKPEILSSIRRLSLESVLSFDGNVVNRTQFPRLERVTLRGNIKWRITLCMDANRRRVNNSFGTPLQEFAPILTVDGTVSYQLGGAGRPMTEYWDGQHDAGIVAHMQYMWSDNTRFSNVGSREERSYDILVQVKLEIFGKDLALNRALKQGGMVSLSNVSAGEELID